MNKIKKFHTPVWSKRWLMVLMCFLCVGAMQTNAQEISPQQIEQLKRLTPEQKQQLIKALGGSSVSAPTETTDTQDISPRPLAETEEEITEDEQFVRLDANESLVIELIANDEGVSLLDDVRKALGKNIYHLDDGGYLRFPGVGKILLAGLTPDEATLRLQAEPNLRNVMISVYLLPLSPVGSASLKPYGYDLFAGAPTTFAPANDIPVPVGYTVGPGDVLLLLIYGQQNAEYRLTVGRDGQINIPEVGPVAVSGMRFDQLREELAKRIEARYIGVSTSLTMGELRSVRVFVLGDVNQPGSYTVSSLSTMTNALFFSGGISTTGSLRNVQLKRSNRVVAELDLYELLLKGNTKGDRRLQPGDVIYVPPVGAQVAVSGQVNRPAIYELRGESTLNAVLELSGGLLPSAYRGGIRIEKFNANGAKSIVIADMNQGIHQNIGAGDQIDVQSALQEIEDGIYVRGHVKRDSVHQWRSGIHLLDIIPSAQNFQVQADQRYMIIRRVNLETGRVRLLTSNWQAAKNNPGSLHNLPLKKADTIYVFSLNSDRAAKIAPLIDEIEAQANYTHPAETASVQGRVRAPGFYPYHDGMRVSDLLLAAGSIRDNAYLENAELTRIQRVGSQRSTVHMPLSLFDLVPGSEKDVLLEPDDVLTVKEIPLYRERQRVEISGEIKFPGTYTASRGERISELVQRAGGLTSMAFTSGSVFLRTDLKERERVNMKQLADRIRTEVNAFDETRVEARGRAESLLEQLDNADPLGRLVIDLNLALRGDPEHDVILEDGDQLIIPPLSQEVTVIGEVQYPTSHIFEKNQDQFSYILKSGGITSNADSRRIYVIRADGKVIAQQGTNWFRRSGGAILAQPGDTIVVPYDADQIGKLALWTSVTQIIYNIGVAAAAVASF